MKQILYAFLLFLLLSALASAAEWKTAAQDTNMNVGESFKVDNYIITLTDIAKNSDGNTTAAVFTVFENDIRKDIVVVELGKSTEFIDGSYKVSLNSIHRGKLWCSCDYLVRPIFVFSSETTACKNYNKTIVYAELQKANAVNVKTKYIINDITLSGSKPAQKGYNSMTVNDNLTNATIKWTGQGTITLKVTYKDTDGNRYEQTYNVLENTIMSTLEQAKSNNTISETTVTTKRISPGRLAAEKKVFKNAITRAMKYIDFSEESKADLNRIINEL